MTSRFATCEHIEDFAENVSALTKAVDPRSVRWGMLDIVLTPNRLLIVRAVELCLVAGALWLRTGMSPVIVWAGVALALLAVRTALSIAYGRATDSVGVEAWEWRFVAVSWTAALVWSALAVLVAASADVFVQFLAIGALERFMSTAVARHNAVPRAALGQIYIVTAAVCAAVVARWDASYGVIGALALVQLFAMHRRVAALHQRALQSFRMQEKAELQATQIERMSAKLSQILTVDTLTKLMNRRGFEATLRKEWSRGISEQVPLSLMMIAIDDFRAYVAGAGMAAGEDALQRVADAVLIELRCPRDVVGRIGNAEIAVLLPQTDMLGTKATAQRILTAIAALGLSASPDGQSALTVSVGGATVVPNSEKLPALLLENADSALNRARSGGPASISIWGLGSETDDERMALASEGPAQPKPTIASLFLGEKAPRQPNPGAPPPRQPAAVADPPRVQPAMNRAL